MNKLTTKKRMQMKTWWALVGARSIKLRSKVKFFNFVPFSRLINFVRQRRKAAKKRGKWYTNHSSNKTSRKSLGPVGSVFLKFFSKHFLKANAQQIRGQIKVHAVRYTLLAPTNTHGALGASNSGHSLIAYLLRQLTKVTFCDFYLTSDL